MPQRDRGAQQRQRDVEQEDPAPARAVHEPAPEERPHGRADAPEPRPQAHRPAPVVGVEGGLDEGERTGREQRAADTLEGAGGDQHTGVRGQTAQQGRGGEPQHAEDEDAAAAEPVAEGAAEEDQPGQRDHVGVDGPLQGGEVGTEVAADVGQRDVDDGRVQQRHAGAEDGGQQDPLALRRGQPDIGHAPRYTASPARRAPGSCVRSCRPGCYLIFWPAERRWPQASTTRAAMPASASLPQVRGS